MSKITNKLNLPKQLVDLISSDYQPKEHQYSCTTILKPTRQVILERRHNDEIEQDVSEMVWCIFGILAHSVIENSQEDVGQFKEEKLKVQSVKTYEDFYKKGMVYFYGNERTEKDLTLAGQYFKKEETNKKKTEAYLLLIEVLNDPEKEVKQDELVSALEICQKDVHDFWSAYFFIDHYILWQEKLPEFVVKKAEKLLYKTEKFRLKEEQKKMLEKQKINLYEIKAKRGDDKLFFQETDRVFHEKLEKNEAWEIYERKLSYLREKSVNIENEYERFIKHYPKVMEAYIEYGIYLCQKNQIEKAKDVYLQGLKQTGMTSNRAKALRRKLGL